MGYRSMMTSDPRAKRQAFIDGVNHTNETHVRGEVPPIPDYMKESPHYKEEPKGYDVKAALKRGAEGLVKYGGPVGPGSGNTAADAAMAAETGYTAATGKKPHDVLAEASRVGVPAAEQPMSPPPAQAPEPSYLAQLAARARNGMPSDKKTKTKAHNSDPMAGANRSMAPSIYEYKPKYAAEAGQSPHEKNVGPMAQNMAADPLAKTAIMKRPDGMLAIDKDKGLKLVMGGLADLQRQVDSMKKKRSA